MLQVVGEDESEQAYPDGHGMQLVADDTFIPAGHTSGDASPGKGQYYVPVQDVQFAEPAGE